MRYYRRHMGDYARDCAHLTMQEDGAYQRLLDLYYTREAPLPADLAVVCRLARARGEDEQAAVHTVLHEFWTLGPDGWYQPRAQAEIAEMQQQSERARAKAEARWHRTSNAPAAPQQPETDAAAMLQHSSGNAEAMQSNIQYPILTSPPNGGERAPKKSRERFSPPTADEVAGYAFEAGLHSLQADRFVDYYASTGWRVGKHPMRDWKAAARNWHARQLEGGGGTAPATGTRHRTLEQDLTDTAWAR